MTRKLDKRDIHILSILQNDARISNAHLAEKVSLSPAACWERVRKLEKEGIIGGYRTEISLEKMPDTTRFIIQITLGRHQRQDFSSFETVVKNFPSIIRCMAVSGGSDYVLEVVVCDMNEYQVFLDRFLERVDNVDQYHAYAVTKCVSSKELNLQQFYDQ